MVVDAIKELKHKRGCVLHENKRLMQDGKLELYRWNCGYISGLTKALNILEKYH